MIQPEQLKTDAPLKWSSGRGTDVWALLCACKEGDFNRVRQLFEKDPNLARCHCSYRKPIYFAVRENHLEIVAFLLDHDPNPFGLAVNDSLIQIASDRGYEAMKLLLEKKLQSQHGISSQGEPLAAAIRSGDRAQIDTLLSAAPELLHAPDLRSCQPIHWAVMTRQIPIVDELLKRGADINAKRADGARPIHLTQGDYHFRGWRDVPKDWPTAPREVYDHLVAQGATIDLPMACATGNLARVQEILDRDPAQVNQVSEYHSYYLGCGSPLKNAAAQGHFEIVRLLLDRGADPNLPEEGIAPQGHAVYSAVANGHHEIVELLISRGGLANAEVESSADTLSRALMNKDQKMVDLLCAHGASRGVHLMAYYNDLQTAAAVFAANPKLAYDHDALANAASEGHEDFVRLMLRYQPNLPKGLSFYSWAVGAKTRELNELLFQHGMNPNAPDWLGITPLHEFARQGQLEKAQIFLEHGADLHSRDEDICSTPLGWAAKFGQLEMVEWILTQGALVQHPEDPPWATPIAWAKRRGHQAIVERLQRASRSL